MRQVDGVVTSRNIGRVGSGTKVRCSLESSHLQAKYVCVYVCMYVCRGCPETGDTVEEQNFSGGAERLDQTDAKHHSGVW